MLITEMGVGMTYFLTKSFSESVNTQLFMPMLLPQVAGLAESGAERALSNGTGIMLPTSGAGLLAFKARTDAPEFRWGGGGVALDDPQERLDELHDFDDMMDEVTADELAAYEAAGAASASIRLATTTDAELQPWHTAMHEILAATAAHPELPVDIAPRLLLGDALAAEDATHLCSLGVTHVLNCSNMDFGMREEYSAAGISYLQLDARDEIGYCMRPRERDRPRNRDALSP
jgi:hypothetical protein